MRLSELFASGHSTSIQKIFVIKCLFVCFICVITVFME